MKKLFFYQNMLKRILKSNNTTLIFIFCFSIFGYLNLHAQAADYTFSEEIGIYEETSSDAETVPNLYADTAISPGLLEIGFDFVYEGITYTQFKMDSNGLISFNPAATSLTTNNLSSPNPNSRPIIAPLWDDLDGRATGGSVAAYEVTGDAPNRVLTVEWRNWEWNYGSTDPVMSFQVKLYETTNVIEFVYRQEAGSINSGSSGASIGIGSATGSGAGSFLNIMSLSDFSISSTEAKLDINTKPQTGQIFRFTPSTCPSPVLPVFENITSDSADVSWTSDGAIFEIQYADYEFNPNNDEGILITNINSTSYQFTMLPSGTTHYLYLRQDCGSGEYSNWSGPYSFFTNLEIAQIPFEEGFENPSGWFLNNGAQANKWYIGSTDDASVEDALYISGDNGTNNTYVNTLSTVHAFKDFEIPSDAENIDIAFDWKTMGETGSTGIQYDYITVWLVPVDYNITAGIQITAGENRIQIGPRLNNNTSFNSAGNVVNVENYQGDIARLVFEWKNDASTSNPPAGVIDNLSISITTCSPVTGSIVVSNEDDTSAEISWESDGVDFDITYGPSGTPIEEWPLLENVASGILITELFPTTNYQVYVRQNCGDGDVSIWSSVGTFKTTQTLAEMPYLEGFEEDNHSWEFVNGSQANKWYVGNAVNNGGERAMYISNDNGQTNTYTVNGAQVSHAFRDIELPFGTTSLDIAFDWRAVGEGSGVNYYDYITVWIVPQTFIPLAGIQISAGTGRIQVSPRLLSNPDFTTQNYVVDVSELDYDIFRLVFEWRNDFGTGTQPPGAIDNVSVSVTSCLPPTEFTLSEVDHNSILLEWTSNNGTSEIMWGEAGFTLEVDQLGNDVNATSPFTVTGLDPSTEYQIYVRDVCGDDDNSIWVGPITVYTGQVPATLPYSEDFESGNHQFTLKNGNQTNKWVVDTAAHDGAENALYISDDDGVTNAYSHTLSVVHAYRDIEISGDVVDVDFSFDWKAAGETCCDYIRVWLAPVTFTPTTGTLIAAANDPALVQIQGNYNNTTTFTTFSDVINVENFAGQTMRLIFEWRNDGGTGTQNPAGAIDNIAISITTCSPVTNLSTSNATESSAELNWESDGTLFDIEWGEVGFLVDSGEGTTISEVSGLSYDLQNLDPDSAYEFYVRQVCTNDSSIWTGPYRFYTGHCIPTGSTVRYITNFTTTGAYQNINNTTADSPNGYGNYTSFVCAQSAGESISISITPTTSTHYFYVWVDWNNDFDFNDEGETMVATTTYAANYNGTITIPEDQPVGSYKMRIANSWSGVITSCGPAANGEYEDYTLQVVETPTCPLPTDLSATITSYTTADLNWSGEGSLYDVMWGLKGFLPEEGTIETEIDTNSFSLVELTAQTAYQYYVRLDCGEDDLSYWAGPYDFFTGYCIPGIPTSGTTSYVINGVSTTGGYTNIANTANGISAGNYGNFSNLSVTQSPGEVITYNVTVPGYTNLEIWVDLNHDFVFDETELIANHTYATTTTTFTGDITLLEDMPLGDYRIRVRSRYYTFTTPSPCGTYNYGETEDYTLSVVMPPVCMNPTNLGVSDTTINSTILNWESDGGLFEVSWGVAGFNVADGNLILEITETSVEVTDMPSENYQFYVRQNCGVDGYSFWSGPFTFRIGYCAPVSSNTGDYISNFTTTDAIENINHSLTSIPGGNGYANYTSMVIEQEAGETVSFTTTYVGGANRILIWVDWNNDGSFSADEQEFNQTFSSATNQGSFVIPDGTPEGNYTLRLRSRFNTSDINACEDITFGDARDYTLSVINSMSVENPIAYSLKYYPNPVKNILNLSNDKEISEVQVYNMLGQKVMSRTINAVNGQLDLAHLASGNYILKVDIDGISKTIKIIKE